MQYLAIVPLQWIAGIGFIAMIAGHSVWVILSGVENKAVRTSRLSGVNKLRTQKIGCLRDFCLSSVYFWQSIMDSVHLSCKTPEAVHPSPYQKNARWLGGALNPSIFLRYYRVLIPSLN